MQRRHFITGCSAALVATSMAPPQLWTGNAVETMRRAGFAKLLGSEFRLFSGLRSVGHVRLEAIDDGPDVAGLEQFTLLWKGDCAECLPEGIYTLETAGAPRLELALEPMDVPQGSRYRSTFSLLS
jgi:hypothetical protein